MRSLSVAAALLLCGLGDAAPQLKKRFTGPSDPARFKFYDTPTKGVICDGDSGPDGDTLWYQDLVAPRVGVFNYKTEKFQEFQIPYSAAVPSTAPQLGNITGIQCVVRTGKDGMVYGGSGIRNEIVQINQRTNPVKIQVFSPATFNPLANLQPFNDAWAADQGLFFSQTTADIVTLFDYETHSFTNYDNITPGSSPLGMRTDKNNNLWFTNFLGQYISKLDNATGEITEYKDCCPLPLSSFPEVLRSSTENQKYLWANAFGGGGYIRIEPDEPDDSKKFKTFTNPLGQGTFPFENSNDYCGRIWYTSPSFDILAHFNPANGKWTNIVVPALIGGGGLPISGNFEVIMHRGPGHYMWFSIGTLGKLVRYTLEEDCVGEPQ